MPYERSPSQRKGCRSSSAPKLPPGEDVPAAWLPLAKHFLLDTFHAQTFGGTGQTGDWPKFARHRRNHPDKTWILAGGLNPANVGAALRESGATFLDVNSGVETAPGVKDHNLLKKFIDAVHEAAPPTQGPFVDLIPEGGLKLTPRHYSYLKISEGCNHRCSFCIIPSIRGDLVSRRIDAVLREAEKLGFSQAMTGRIGSGDQPRGLRVAEFSELAELVGRIAQSGRRAEAAE